MQLKILTRLAFLIFDNLRGIWYLDNKKSLLITVCYIPSSRIVGNLESAPPSAARKSKTISLFHLSMNMLLLWRELLSVSVSARNQIRLSDNSSSLFKWPVFHHNIHMSIEQMPHELVSQRDRSLIMPPFNFLTQVIIYERFLTSKTLLLWDDLSLATYSILW